MVLVDGDRNLHKQLYNVRYLPLVPILTELMQQTVQHGDPSALVMELNVSIYLLVHNIKLKQHVAI